MGWYGDFTTCPNCKKDTAVCQFRNNIVEGYYLICVNCGLHLYAAERTWDVSNTYINKSVIGKNV